MATPPSTRRISNESKKSSSSANPFGVTTRNGARKAKIQTRAMSGTAKPSIGLIAAKKKGHQKKGLILGDFQLLDTYQKAMDSRYVVRGEIGMVTEPRMLEHHCLWDDNYPECPERLSSIIDRCNDLGLLKRCKCLQPRSATKEEVIRLHSPDVYDLLLSTHNSDDMELLESISSKYDAIYIHPSSHELALIAAGSTIDLVEAVARGNIMAGAALIRPPGHHAMTAEPCGYCFYNNVALAARHALESCGKSRILIVDWDVHHGQATQQMFYDDPRVVYFSIHRYEHGSFWPNLRQSNYNYVGCGSGTGYNFNVPLNDIKMQDSDYLAIWYQILLPMAVEFQPELVLVSAGYDAALGCPEGQMEVSPACYAHLTHLLLGVCSSVAVVLEGGYCLASLAEGAALTVRALLGDPAPPLPSYTPPCQSIKETILNCIYTHKPYWKCFNYQPTYSTDTSVLNVSDVGKEKHTVDLQWLGDECRPDSFATRECYPKQSQQFLDEVHRRLTQLKLTTNLSSPPHRVCYVYDDGMLKHRNICDPGHPEHPERIASIHSRLSEWGLLKRLHSIDARHASDEELQLAHGPSLLALAKSTITTPPRALLALQTRYDSLYLHPESFTSASIAAGSVLKVVDSVLGGESRCGVCAVRPPGHHASEDIPSGFCIFNNVAIAVKYALSYHSLKRILIVDWDVHHGNGTQSIFLDDPRVLYVSIHRYDRGTFFPHSQDGDHTQVGSGAAAGFNVNIPWNKRGMGDTEYLAAFIQVVLPIAYEFNPELVLVSAGFDACIGDPLGGCKVSPECFGRFTHWLSGLANGKIILCLEGGYNVTAISYSMAMCTKALLGDPIAHLHDPKGTPNPSAVESINDVIKVQKKYWKNLCFQVALPKEDVLPAPVSSRGLEIMNSKINPLKILNQKSPKSDVDTSGFDSSIDQDSSYDSRKMQDSTFEKSMLSITDNTEKLSINTKDLLQSGDNLKINVQISFETDSYESKSNFLESKNPQPVVVSDSDNTNSKNDSVPRSSSSDPKPGSSGSGGNEGQPPIRSLADYLAENMQAIVNEEMYAVVPLPDCPHVQTVTTPSSVEVFTQGLKCANCDHTEENWVCLHCHMRACGRYISGHMVQHCEESGHALVLSLLDLSVWCSVCEAYIDSPHLYQHRDHAHRAKFSEPLPWSYGEDKTLHLSSN